MQCDFSFHPAQSELDAAKDLLLRSSNVVITCHVSPDGDALGSSLGLLHVLKALKPQTPVEVVTPDCPPRQLSFIPGVGEIIPATRFPEKAGRLFERADLIICLDFNDPSRLDKLRPQFEQSKAERILIDHHLDPLIDARIKFSYPQISSTSAILYMLLCEMGWEKMVGLKAGECICTGMITDTGNFSYNSLDPDLYLILARLVRLGVDKDRLYDLAMNTATESRIRICGYGRVKMNILKPHRASLIVLSRRELAEFDYSKGDTEALVNVPLKMDSVEYSIFLRQDEPQLVKVSMRSKGSFPVNKICEEHFGGGGHLNAAGGEFKGTIEECVTAVLGALPDYDKYLPDKK